jgi:ABC-type phosphate/phosphonate transport system substrate-binding protein
MRTASLAMYDCADVQSANDALWGGVAEQLAVAGVPDVPLRLDRTRSLSEIWSDAGLLLAQCCGYPFVSSFSGRLRYVATPRYQAPGCIGATYSSRFIVRADDPAERLADLRGRRAAINDRDSNSGMNVFREAVAGLASGNRFFSSVIETGSHFGSAEAVSRGDADIAAIDSVTYVHLERYRPEIAQRLRTVGWSETTPGLPLVTSWSTPSFIVVAMRKALDRIALDPRFDQPRRALLIDGFEVLPVRKYLGIWKSERRAERLGYPELA